MRIKYGVHSLPNVIFSITKIYAGWRNEDINWWCKMYSTSSGHYKIWENFPHDPNRWLITTEEVYRSKTPIYLNSLQHDGYDAN